MRLRQLGSFCIQAQRVMFCKTKREGAKARESRFSCETSELTQIERLPAVSPGATDRGAFCGTERHGVRQRRLTARATSVESHPHTRDEGRR